jgi:hypothetical protein
MWVNFKNVPNFIVFAENFMDHYHSLVGVWKKVSTYNNNFFSFTFFITKCQELQKFTEESFLGCWDYVLMLKKDEIMKAKFTSYDVIF